MFEPSVCSTQARLAHLPATLCRQRLHLHHVHCQTLIRWGSRLFIPLNSDSAPCLHACLRSLILSECSSDRI